MITKLIELDFDEPILLRTPIILNQANINSVVFDYKIYKGSNEIKYTEYSKAELVFRKADGENVVENGSISINGISYTLNEHIFDIANTVTGQINLYKDGTLSATLHYNFRIIPDLLNLSRSSVPYIGALEKLIAELELIIQQKLDANTVEIERMIAELKSNIASYEKDSLQVYNEFIKLINQLKIDAIDIYDKFVKKINEIEVSLNVQVDKVIETTEQRTDDFLLTMQALLEEQQLILEGIQNNDFVVNSIFNQHRRNHNSNEQHLSYNDNAYIFSNGQRALPDANEIIPLILNHDLGKYPMVSVMRVLDGFGSGSFGEVPFGGDNISEFVRHSHIDKGNLKLFLADKILDASLNKVDNNTFLIFGGDYDGSFGHGQFGEVGFCGRDSPKNIVYTVMLS